MPWSRSSHARARTLAPRSRSKPRKGKASTSSRCSGAAICPRNRAGSTRADRAALSEPAHLNAPLDETEHDRNKTPARSHVRSVQICAENTAMSLLAQNVAGRAQRRDLGKLWPPTPSRERERNERASL